MKKRIPTLRTSIFATGLLIAGVASAQTQSQPMQQATPPTQGTTATSPTQSTVHAGSTGANSATYSTAQGQVQVNSTMGSTPSAASPPAFEQLANGKKYISKQDADAYPPLANDFLYASHNGDRITKAQYERWVKNLN
ncbi:hypothetical protein [Dyella flagellata]|uniref:Uncharacterized protein n=1 Tax=Dyella flagellata TaxID=1867833 RepID=A0ABQ5XAM2_9GAMM|nr:hypothetical protein [Dyella flagellata]GLQ87585.1 hypothetical protein GCM10007898_11510 [Dyella flagellata]